MPFSHYVNSNTSVYAMQLPAMDAAFQRRCAMMSAKFWMRLNEATSLMSGKQYSFLGHSNGGLFAFELASRFIAQDKPPARILSPQKHRRTLRILSMIRCIQMMMKWPKYCVVMAELNLIFWMTLISEAYFSYYTQRAVD